MSTTETPTVETKVDGRAGDRSRELMEAAQRVIPGGVNSPVRAFGPVGGDPPFVRKAKGPHIITEDGVALIDYVGTWGPAILGHAHPEVIDAVQKAVRDGLSFGAASAGEVDFAELVCSMVPSLQGGMVRMVNSGTEATMSALRLARGYTGRDKIIKMDGGYHGHADFLLVAAGSGAATLGLPGTAGVPADVVKQTLLAPQNDLDAIRAIVAQHPDDIAAIIVEPVCGNMGCVPPEPGYLEGLREITAEHGIVLIFDEVMTGFRLAKGGAQELFGVTPDLTALGKIVGGGLPCAAYGGKREIMEKLAPVGPVYQAGTLSGNPIAVAAGMATLKILERDSPYAQLDAMTERLAKGITEAADAAGLPFTSNRVGSMFTGFFRSGRVRNYEDAKASNLDQFTLWHAAMLERGVYLAPSQFESGFVSVAHTEGIIDQTVAAAKDAMLAVAAAG